MYFPGVKGEVLQGFQELLTDLYQPALAVVFKQSVQWRVEVVV